MERAEEGFFTVRLMDMKLQWLPGSVSAVTVFAQCTLAFLSKEGRRGFRPAVCERHCSEEKGKGKKDLYGTTATAPFS